MISVSSNGNCRGGELEGSWGFYCTWAGWKFVAELLYQSWPLEALMHHWWVGVGGWGGLGILCSDVVCGVAFWEPN